MGVKEKEQKEPNRMVTLEWGGEITGSKGSPTLLPRIR